MNVCTGTTCGGFWLGQFHVKVKTVRALLHVTHSNSLFENRPTFIAMELSGRIEDVQKALHETSDVVAIVPEFVPTQHKPTTQGTLQTRLSVLQQLLITTLVQNVATWQDVYVRAR